MTPRALSRLLSFVVVLLSASMAGAATTEFRVFFDTDRNPATGCTVGGMSGVEQVLVTQVTDSGAIARVTRTFRQLCTGTTLGAITGEDFSGSDAVFEPVSRELTFETWMPVSAFGPNGITRDMRVGFEASRLPATHVALVNDDGSEVVLHQAAPRRRGSRSPGTARIITLDGKLNDWAGVDSTIYGAASGGTNDLRLLRVFAWEDSAGDISQRFLYFAVVLRLASEAPFADDDVFYRQAGQSLSVAGPGVLANDGDPLGQDLDAEIVTQPARGSVVLNEEEGGFTYAPDNPLSKSPDSFEYRVRAGSRVSNVARVRINVNDDLANAPPSFVSGGDITVADSSGLYESPWATGISAGAQETQTVTFTVTNDNPALFSTQPTIAPNGTLRFFPATNREGGAVVTVTLTDSEGASSAPVTFHIFVASPTAAPRFAEGPNQVVLEDAGPQTVNDWAMGIGPGAAGQPVAFTIVSNSNPSLFSAAPVVSQRGDLTYTPAPNANGTATIRLRLASIGAPAPSSPTREFTITVTPVNDAPSFTAGPSITMIGNDAQTFPAWATAILAGPPNESGQALNFIVTNDNPALFSVAPAIAPNGTLTFTPVAGVGAATVTVRLHDNGGVANGGVDTSAAKTFEISIESVPLITSPATATFTVGQPGAFVVRTSGRPTPTLEQSGTLPNGVTWVEGTGANQGTGTLSGTPAVGTGGAYSMAFRARNSRGLSRVQTFTLIVNEAPRITSANTVFFTQRVPGTFTITTSGYPVATVAISGGALPAGLTFVPRSDGTARITGEPTAPFGAYVITLTASNGIGAPATQSFTIRVNPEVYPMPGSQSEAPVMCTGCLGTNAFGQTNDGLPTFPYGPPILDHVGRYVDSQTTANFQHIGFRTARARTIRTFPQAAGQAPPRVYIQIGNALGAYALDTFFSTKLPAGPTSVDKVLTGTKVGGFGRTPPEKIVMWDGFVYPEALASLWYAPLLDQQDPMAKGGPFDADDRGYVYASWPSFGWGIVKDDGRTDTAHFPKVVQMVGSVAGVDQEKYPNTRLDTSRVSAQSILAIRSGGKYYAVIGGGSNTMAVFDVTTPETPVLLGTYPGAAKAIIRYDRSDAYQRVAYIDGGRNLQVYSYDALVNGGEPILTEARTGNGFQDVAFDDAGNIWAIEGNRLVKLAPSGNGYVSTSYAAPFGPTFGSMSALAVGGGYLAVTGITTGSGAPTYDVRLAKIGGGAPVDVPLGGFFKNYYHGGAKDFAQPGQYTFPSDLQLIRWKGRTYLMYSAEGLGDVFELQSP